jgi:hypothetical protein
MQNGLEGKKQILDKYPTLEKGFDLSKDFSKNIVEKFCECLMKKEVQFDSNEDSNFVLDFYDLCNHVGHLPFKSRCLEFFRTKMYNRNNILELLIQVYKGNYPLDHDCVREGVKFLARHFHYTSHSKLFYKLPSEYLIELLQQDYICIKDEIELFKAIREWTSHNKIKLDRFIYQEINGKRVVDLIRFELFDQTSYRTIIHDPKLLTEKESDQYSSFFLQKKSTTQIQRDFSYEQIDENSILVFWNVHEASLWPNPYDNKERKTTQFKFANLNWHLSANKGVLRVVNESSSKKLLTIDSSTKFLHNNKKIAKRFCVGNMYEGTSFIFSDNTLKNAIPDNADFIPLVFELSLNKKENK